MQSCLLTIDFEASCLPCHGRSFPIEVGIADLTGWSRSWLIRPAIAWTGWDWTEEAENLHGLERGRLLREGIAASRVMEELTHAVGNRRVVADSAYDTGWLGTLATAADVTPPFRIDHVSQLMDEWRSSPDDIAAAFRDSSRLPVRRHSAKGDAQWLAQFIALLEPKKSIAA